MEAITREEMFLSDIAGDTKYNLEPITRTEKLLKKIAENGTGGGFGPVVTYGDTLTWDGSTEGLVSVADMLYKISDNVLTIEDVKDGITVGLSNKTSTSYSYEEISQAYTEYGIIAAGGVYNIPSANFELMGMVFPEAGIYVMNAASATSYTESITIPGYKGFETTTYPKIPIESLPEGYPYAEEGIVALIEEQTLTAGSDGMMAVNKAINLTIGETYKVTWNGTTYNCVAVEADLSSFGFGTCPTLGNLSPIGGANTGEPFVMAVISANNITGFMPLDGSTTATVKVEGMGEVVHKMDEKYLPETTSIYTFKGLITTDMVNGWADDDNPNPVLADELFNTILPLVLEGKTLFFLEIVDDYITDRFPCELITVMASPFTAGEYQIVFRFSVDRNSSKKAEISIGNISGD